MLQPKEFSDALEYMVTKGVIDPNLTQIELYNWAEPFLHPKFETMLKIAANKGFKFGLSTNGSIFRTIPYSTVHNLSELRFSMSGFSQESYDRIKGLNFDVILRNIRDISEQIREISTAVHICIAFHVYDFNRSETTAAKAFCNELEIDFLPIYAYLNGFTMAKDYYSGIMPKEKCKNIENELITDQLEAIRQNRPTGYQCPQSSILVLDEFCNVLQCCGTDRNLPAHVIGKLWNVDFEDLHNFRSNSSACLLCSKLKIDYMWHNATVCE